MGEEGKKRIIEYFSEDSYIKNLKEIVATFIKNEGINGKQAVT
jgi:hypothetical protein